jgi:CPA2 family monovalent cation:H+ antiporter-2
MVLNGTVVFALARLFGLTTRKALETALLLAAAGEFAFVILSSAIVEGIVERQVGQTILVASTLSMFCIPLLAALGAKFGGRPGASSATVPVNPSAAPDASAESPGVLVVGYGRVGKLVGDMLSRHDIAWVAAERDVRLVEAGRRGGHAVWFGDASRVEFLNRCGLEQARALIVTMDNPEGNRGGGRKRPRDASRPDHRSPRTGRAPRKAPLRTRSHRHCSRNY